MAASAAWAGANPRLVGQSIRKSHTWLGSLRNTRKVISRSAELTPHARQIKLSRSRSAFICGSSRVSCFPAERSGSNAVLSASRSSLHRNEEPEIPTRSSALAVAVSVRYRPLFAERRLLGGPVRGTSMD